MRRRALAVAALALLPVAAAGAAAEEATMGRVRAMWNELPPAAGGGAG
jgi:hypothetical protein